MGNLYIRLLNGIPVEHPITEANLLSAYPGIDLDNLPESWANFVRVLCPKLGVYEVAESRYEWVGDVVSDVWYTHQMGDEEKRQKQERIKASWANDCGAYVNWVFDEATCTHKPPVAMPTDGKPYIWVQAANTWVEMPPEKPLQMANAPLPPQDGKQYVYNESSNSWTLKT